MSRALQRQPAPTLPLIAFVLHQAGIKSQAIIYSLENAVRNHSELCVADQIHWTCIMKAAFPDGPSRSLLLEKHDSIARDSSN